MARSEPKQASADKPNTLSTVQLIKVFVSSPSDVAAERAVLDEVCESINDTDGQFGNFRMELFRWEDHVTPQIGPGPQRVVDSQTPVYNIYLGIMSTRFGTPTGRFGSGTEQEFRDALKGWKKAGSPWITFYFDAAPKLTGDPEQAEQFLRVCKFRAELQKKGIVASYCGLRESKDGFFAKVSTHLRQIAHRLRQQKQPKPDGVRGKKKPSVPTVPQEYLSWLLGRCGEVELMGLQPKHGAGVRLNQIYTPLVTSVRSEHEAGSGKKRSEDLLMERGEPVQLLLDLLAEQSLYVSGDPGAGKSTFCRWVTWLTCNGAVPSVDVPAPEGYREHFPAVLHRRLPVLVPLRDFWVHLPSSGARAIGLAGLERALGAWLAEQKPHGPDWGCVQAHLENGSTVLMLDGVDEVPPLRTTQRDEWYPRQILLDVLPEALKRWTEAGNRVLVTSRPYGVDSNQLQQLGVLNAPIQGLDQELQKLLVRRWFVRLDESPERGLERAEAMIEHLHGERALDELAANPLLLTAMCIIYDEGKRLPEDKYELYNRIVDTVLHKRYPASAKETVIQIRGRLAAVALGMHTGEDLGQQRANPEASASADEIDLLLKKYRQANALTDDGLRDTFHVREDLLSKSGLLVLRGDGRAQFYHLSFQEFLAAERLFLKLSTERLFTQSCEEDGFPLLLLERGLASGWRNTLSFLFGGFVSKFNADAGVALLRAMVSRTGSPEGDRSQREPVSHFWNPAIVLGDCLEILLGRKAVVPKELRGYFEDIVIQAIELEIAVETRHTLAVVLGRLGDARIVPDLRAAGHPKDHRGYVEIPVGTYYYGEEKKPFSIDRPFRLSRYPVTNAQYAVFLDDKGYERPEFWSEAGWRWLEQARVNKPEYWRHPDFSAPNQPVVGVSFWEAEAFARWAGGALPTERQWEAAARGPEGHEYTWGDQWEDGICNSSEAGLQSTSAVGIFPRSRSVPFGLEDMAGNVFEWCADFLDPNEVTYREIRGGCCYFDSRYCRASYLLGNEPESRFVSLGFRVALVPSGGQAG